MHAGDIVPSQQCMSLQHAIEKSDFAAMTLTYAKATACCGQDPCSQANGNEA